MAVKKTDQKILDLIEEVNRRKAEISSIEHPAWKTKCSFSYYQHDLSKSLNLHVINNVRELISIAAFLSMNAGHCEEGALMLGITTPPPFTWQGHSYDDWLHDLRLRVAQIQISQKRDQLKTLEERLNAIITPELRAQMEIDAITKELQ